MNTKDFDTHGMDRKVRQEGRSLFRVAARSPAFWLPLLFPFALAVYASAQTTSTGPSVLTILARMAQARTDNQARFRSYVVTRDYRLFGKERLKAKFEATADVTFVPPDSKKYAIQQAKGSVLGKSIVRRMLASEVSMAKDCASAELSPRNYDFRFVREEESGGQPCYVLELLPRRDEKNLLRGNIWVDANTYLIHRIEGELAKAPSWWLRNVRIAFLYSSVGGMWLQTALEATATVRLLGPYTIVTQDLKYSVDEAIAGASPPLGGIPSAAVLGAAPTTSDASQR